MFSEVFEVYLIFTRNCNLRCSYCYQEKTNKSVSKEVLDKILNFIEQHEKVSYINLFGGEAFTKLDEVEYFVDGLIKIKKEQSRDFNVYTNTNGTIYNDKFIKLLNKLSDNFKFHYVISIDGNKHFHDSARRTISGEPTYDLIMRNIKLIKKNSPKTLIDFHTVIQKEMCDDFYNIAKEIIRNPDFDLGAFEFLMKVDKKIHYSISDLENIYLAIMKLNQEGYSMRFLMERFNNIVKNIDYEYNNFNVEKEYCQNGVSSLTVDYNGKVYPCDYYLSLDEKDQEKFWVHNLLTGETKDNISRLEKLTTETEKQAKKCINCNAKCHCYICTAAKDIDGQCGFELECEQNLMIYQAINNVKFKIS